MGAESTSNNKYDPPCKSSPKLTFLDMKKLPDLKKFDKANSDKKIIIK
jgi:hypothetical protein